MSINSQEIFQPYPLQYFRNSRFGFYGKVYLTLVLRLFIGNVIAIILTIENILPILTFKFYQKYYANRLSNPKLINFSQWLTGILNNLLISTAILYLLSSFSLINLVIVYLVSAIVLGILNISILKVLPNFNKSIILTINELISNLNVKNLEKQRIIMDSLVTLKEFYTLDSLYSLKRPVKYSNASTAAHFLSLKINNLIKKNSNNYSLLDRETNQTIKFLASLSV